MEILRSLLFIPSANEKMLDKINILKPDCFILDLEDSVPIEAKNQARINIVKKLENIDFRGKISKVFIRINDLDSQFAQEDINVTISQNIDGYMIPKFDDINKLNVLEKLLAKKENEKKIALGAIKLILMVENPKGLLEISRLENKNNRIIAIALGFEDFMGSIIVFSDISYDFLDFVRKTVLINSKANNLLTIDTIYKNFQDVDGFRLETNKVVKMGFNGKLAIHPSQIDIINECFMPKNEEIERMELILKNMEKIEKEGAINIDGVMFDLPHLKWALKVKKYLDEVNRKYRKSI